MQGRGYSRRAWFRGKHGEMIRNSLSEPRFRFERSSYFTGPTSDPSKISFAPYRRSDRWEEKSLVDLRDRSTNVGVRPRPLREEVDINRIGAINRSGSPSAIVRSFVMSSYDRGPALTNRIPLDFQE